MIRWWLILAIPACAELPPTITPNDPATFARDCPSETAFPADAVEYSFEPSDYNLAALDQRRFSLTGSLSASDTSLVALRGCAFEVSCTPGHEFASFQTCGSISLNEGIGMLRRLAVRSGSLDGGIESGLMEFSHPFRIERIDGGISTAGALELTDGRRLEWNAYGSQR